MERREMLNAESELWNQMFSFLKSMSLKCAVELGIPDAIHNHGQPMTLSELHAALSLPIGNKINLHRLLRMLTQSGFLAAMTIGDNKEVVYDLTNISRLVVNKDNSSSLSPFVIGVLDFVMVKPSLHLADMLKQEKLEAFTIAHGCSFWELTGKLPVFNTQINNAMAGDSSFISNFIINKAGNIFQGVSSLVDVGGGSGSIAVAIAKAFPNIKCSVLDLPQVVRDLPNDVVNFVSGDMFKHIPSADVVFLKWILSDWSDEDCIKILKRCKEAIPPKDAGGKVIIVDVVLGPASIEHRETQLLLDMMMMTAVKGRQHDEKEWWDIFKEAGFSSYKIVATLGVPSIIEVYP